MITNPTGWCWWRTALLIFLFLSIPSVGLTRTKSGNDFDIANIIRPALVNAQADPTLRFPIMRGGGSIFTITYGWLDISSSTIRYTVVQPPNRASHSFEVSRFGIRDLRLSREWVTFDASKKSVMLVYLPQDRWGTIHSGPGMGSAANRESLGTSSIYKTLMNYDGVLALVKPPAPAPAPIVMQPVAPAPPKPVAPPSPPVIVLSAPPGAGENQILEVEESTVIIRGVTMDSNGIPVMRINGSPANMRPQSTRAAEFWSDPLPLQAGSNHIQIVASNLAHVDARLDFIVDYKPKTATVNPRALGKEEIISLLQGGVPVGHIAELVKDRGIKFTPTSADLNDIRASGGSDELIQAIQQTAPHS